jgi:ABC-type transport system involved in multi-copper enzyme maturation permease subunit
MARIAWGMYAAIGLLGVVLAARAPAAVPAAGIGTNEAIMVALLNALQVSVGLVLLSVGAATAMAEERARGSLEVLLSTPMSTRSILAGKWWGGYRRVLGVAIWPALTTAFLARNGGYWRGDLLLIGLVLAHGAAITALGLAIAIWVKRPGRAVALGVATPFLLAIGWPILVILVAREADARSLGQALVTGDPPVGVMFATMAAAGMNEGRIAPGATRGDIFAWTAGWIAVMAIAASALFGTAVGTFDACLDRAPDAGIRPPRPPGRRSSLSADELLALVPGADGEEP